MNLKIPKNDKYQWTQHSIFKMRQYGLSAQRVIRVIRNPERTEEGIVEKTIAVMQPASTRVVRSPAPTRNRGESTRGGPASKTWSQEIWVMYQLRGSGAPHLSRLERRDTLSQNWRGGLGSKIKIISAWRYPGVSPKNNPIPEEILRELESVT